MAKRTVIEDGETLRRLSIKADADGADLVAQNNDLLSAGNDVYAHLRRFGTDEAVTLTGVPVAAGAGGELRVSFDSLHIARPGKYVLEFEEVLADGSSVFHPTREDQILDVLPTTMPTTFDQLVKLVEMIQSATNGPPPVTGLGSSVASTTSVRFTWTQHPQQETLTVLDAQVKEGDSSWEPVALSTDETEYTREGLTTSGLDISFRIRAVNNEGASLWNTAERHLSDTDAPEPVTDFAVTDVGDGEVEAFFTSAGPDADHYVLLLDGQEQETVEPGVVLFDGLTNGQQYTFAVRTYDAAANYADSTSEDATPSAPVDTPEALIVETGESYAVQGAEEYLSAEVRGSGTLTVSDSNSLTINDNL